jgi:hypothetical protein
MGKGELRNGAGEKWQGTFVRTAEGDFNRIGDRVDVRGEIRGRELKPGVATDGHEFEKPQLKSIRAINMRIDFLQKRFSAHASE